MAKSMTKVAIIYFKQCYRNRIIFEDTCGVYESVEKAIEGINNYYNGVGVSEVDEIKTPGGTTIWQIVVNCTKLKSVVFEISEKTLNEFRV